MLKSFRLILLGGLVLIGLSGTLLQAQNPVCNPYFSTMDLIHWDGDDPSLTCILGNTNWGVDNYCCKKSPGSPYNNGSITQEVHLMAGWTYQFSANIAATYICPG